MAVYMAVWLSDNTLASINVVALRQTRLVLRWVTVCGLDPRTVAVSCYGWLKTSYGWLAG